MIAVYIVYWKASVVGRTYVTRDVNQSSICR